MRFGRVALAVTFVALVAASVPAQQRLVGPPVREDASDLSFIYAGFDWRYQQAPAAAIVANPYRYYANCTTKPVPGGLACTDHNPLGDEKCTWAWVYTSGAAPEGARMNVTSTDQNNPDWAFQVTIPGAYAEACGLDFVNIHWKGQGDVRTGTAPPTYQGLGLKCQVEQNGKIIPCAGTGALRPYGPYMVRNDYDQTGQQSHTSFTSINLLPQYIDDETPGDIIVRVGLYTTSNAPTLASMWNQTLAVATGTMPGPRLVGPEQQ